MKLEKIITLANKKSKNRFLAMERSLRSVGCKLPLQVIPYDDDLFELPEGASWWRVDHILELLDRENAHPMMRKYQCLTIKNYQFVDADICFLRNPEAILESLTGFVTCCGHWRNPEGTTTQQSIEYFRSAGVNWQHLVFNAGQFACDQELYSVDSLLKQIQRSDLRATLLDWPHNDQPGLNLLVRLSGVTVRNLMLPPYNFQSSWAGDYPDEYLDLWSPAESQKPYLIHWAGLKGLGARPIDSIALAYLNEEEKKELDANDNTWKKAHIQNGIFQRIFRCLVNRKKFPEFLK